MKAPDRRIEAVTARPPTTLLIHWTTGDVTPVDLSADIEAGGPYAALADPAVFATARPVRWGHAVEWEGEIGMGADSLWADACRQNPLPDARVVFEAWKTRHALSLTTAAHVLGLTRRTVAAYASGARPIPKLVLLACEGYEARSKAGEYPRIERVAA